MRQVMTARQAFECYVSDMNSGGEFLKKHFPERYSDVVCNPSFIGKEHCIFDITPCVSENGVDVVESIRASSVLEDMDVWLKDMPRMAHSGSIYYDGVFQMIFSKSTLNKRDARRYMRLLGVE